MIWKVSERHTAYPYHVSGLQLACIHYLLLFTIGLYYDGLNAVGPQSLRDSGCDFGGGLLWSGHLEGGFGHNS
ncbi:hypothetical protein BJ508DRAFT_417469 [Ascobolus immersus RN42]|uniref:Uncharacterized protein n=1 Tax=Ascobolus immersus RN42 TaxID=1160509 RepID=A0A3N4HW55_ASCIM|nr:hypothetical protein BJ508DRAFT_417469 [Ascobolus immersus RN42]